MASFLVLFFISSCQENPIAIEARVTKVTPYYESKHYDLPHASFSILVKNRGDSDYSSEIDPLIREADPSL